MTADAAAVSVPERRASSRLNRRAQVIYLTALGVVLIAAAILVFAATRSSGGGGTTKAANGNSGVALATTTSANALASRKIQAIGDAKLRHDPRKNASIVAQVAPGGATFLATPVDAAGSWYRVRVSDLEDGTFVRVPSWKGPLPELLYISSKVTDSPTTTSSSH